MALDGSASSSPLGGIELFGYAAWPPGEAGDAFIPMSTPFHDRASEILSAALEQPEHGRFAFLAERCGADQDLHREVLSLLAYHDEDFLGRPLQVDPRLLEAPADGRLPREFGPFRLIRMLGSGGSGVVFEAEQEHPRRRVAVKILRHSLILPDTSGRMRREAQVLAQLQHPGIAQIYMADTVETEAGPQAYLAMELVEGRPLDRFVREENPPLRARLDLFLNICGAVQHAHDMGVVHRDLKPDNILVDGQGRPRVLDFGVARMTDADMQVTTFQAGTGQVIGTLPYMSPEQAAGRFHELDIRSDVYSMGVVLYEMLTAQLPYEVRERSLHEVLRLIQEAEPVRPRRWIPDLHVDLETILLKCLKKDPRRRYWSVMDLAGDLRRQSLHQPISARRPTILYRASRFSARNRLLVGGLTSLFVILLAAVVVTGSALWKERQRNQEVQQLSTLKTMRDLVEEAKWLWPAEPRQEAALRSWLARADEMLLKLPEFPGGGRGDPPGGESPSRDALPEGSVERAADGTAVASSMASAEERYEAWWIESLDTLARELSAFRDADPSLGTYASVCRRLEQAGRIGQESITDYSEAWRRCMASVADQGECPSYGGLRIQPQVGLVPLGRDPLSGFWEFSHLPTGTVADFDPATGTYLREDSGLVFVLLPGGSMFLGAQPKDPDGQNYDPNAWICEGGVVQAALDAFFLSKYEITGLQWREITGAMPNYYHEELVINYSGCFDPRQPMENVSWLDCERLLLWAGLRFPTEAQWEFAARAGTPYCWGDGPDRESLRGAANLSDVTAKRSGYEGYLYEDWLVDGYTIPAPVGSFRANPFGLHDMAGNVAEWCWDNRPVYSRDAAPRPGDGLIQTNRDRRVARGGSWTTLAVHARVSARLINAPGFLSDDIGLRPARPLDPVGRPDLLR